MFTAKKKERRPSSSGISTQPAISNSQYPGSSLAYSSPPSMSSFYSVGNGGTGGLLQPGEPPLPQGWDARIDGRGRRYFVDHNTKSTSWFHPLVPQPMFPSITNPHEAPGPNVKKIEESLDDLKLSGKTSSPESTKLFAKDVDVVLSPETLGQWEQLIQKSEERKVKLNEAKVINEQLERKIEQKRKKISQLSEKIVSLEKKCNHSKGIGIENMDLKELQNFIKDVESAAVIARQREIYLKEKVISIRLEAVKRT
eukprot:TRINITY_DN1156_c0_g1_i3.p1 TRINITY_DN1156_c0_g1~~TRINITY_DN1156_c0_g1_i3.p1  ORF type:complete len:255 (+),score=50.30 TRINITY_DN1156_c0_g1_i3:69-833(+)